MKITVTVLLYIIRRDVLNSWVASLCKTDTMAGRQTKTSLSLLTEYWRLISFVFNPVDSVGNQNDPPLHKYSIDSSWHVRKIC